MHHLPNLNELLQYRNSKVINKFKRDFPALADQAEPLFTELMKYLWLAQKHANDQLLHPVDNELRFLFAIYDDMVNVDHMWHCFILSTHEYDSFCQTYFGRFLHHIPDALDELPPTKEDLAEDMGKFASYVFDNLGEATVRNWFGMQASE